MTAINSFIQVTDSLVDFESDFKTLDRKSHTKFTLEIHMEEIKSIWSKIKEAYSLALDSEETPIENKSEEDSKKPSKSKLPEVPSIKAKYRYSYQIYTRCLGKISEMLENLSKQSKNISSDNSESHSFHVPPCDIEVFAGDYLKWPSFRDLFTAVYASNTRLSKVEKLFHLNSKTSGAAHEIVSKAPLTNDGFDIAWSNLKGRFENKRILVNSQLRILFNLKPISEESGSAIKGLQSEVNNSISALKLHKIDISNWDCILIYICSTRLPELTLSLWEQSVKTKTEIPSWEDFDTFLTARYQTLETVSDFKSSNSYSKPSTSKSVKTFQTKISNPDCKLCPNQQHTIRNCPKFLRMKVEDRFNFVKKRNLCLNCFSSSHDGKNCSSKYSCFTCHKRHNTLLHRDDAKRQNNVKPHFNKNKTHYNPNNSSSSQKTNSIQSNALSIENSNQTSTSNSQNVQSCVAASSSSVLLGTAIVQIFHLGTFYPARALIDTGSEGSFITEQLFNRLKLPAQSVNARISGINNGTSQSRKVCSLILSSHFNPGIRIEANAFVIPQVTGNIPSCHLNISNFSDLSHLNLADSEFYRSSKVDLLIGCDLIPLIMRNGIKHNISGSLLAQETVFGWILSGPIPSSTISSFSTSIVLSEEDRLDKAISRFWEVEELPQKRFLSADDQFCEDLFVKTTKRSSDGRYIVSLPFKEDFPANIELGQSRSGAYAQFLRNETRLGKTPDIKADYDQVLLEYFHLDQMNLIPSPSFEVQNPLHFYLPHHAVLKPESTTTKLRVVFNASSKSSNGRSLNDILHIGPTLQMDLTLLVLRWRLFQYVFNADIEKMYRQILIEPSQTSFQRILFRESKDLKLRDYELKTVTFGVNCAPYLAIRTLHQLANDVKEKFPHASTILKNFMYVDDALAGAHDINTAISARNELISALSSAGFSLRKWTANSKQLLCDLPQEHIYNSDFLEFEDSSLAKPLGIRWNAQADTFFFAATPLLSKEIFTKREILSQIAKLFDPAGWLSPCIVLAKMLMQQIWLAKIGWDDNVPNSLLISWQTFIKEFPKINNIPIPRWVNYSPECDVQFHVFCDASEKAYAASLYIRVVIEGNIYIHLLSSKSKVAPVKTVSLPRLELCGAVLAAELSDVLLPQLGIENYSVYFWTDSTIVLSWLRKPPCQWSTFVANRVSKIVQWAGQATWFHVDTHNNPADLATRGVFPGDLIDHKLWWYGPEWLSKVQSQWPYSNADDPYETELELKSIRSNACFFKNYDDILERFSNFSKALRIIALVFRFFHKIHPKHRAKSNSISKHISSEEITFVKERLILIAQKVNYPEEFNSLSKKQNLASSSSLLTFNPCCDPICQYK